MQETLTKFNYKIDDKVYTYGVGDLRYDQRRGFLVIEAWHTETGKLLHAIDELFLKSEQPEGKMSQ